MRPLPVLDKISQHAHSIPIMARHAVLHLGLLVDSIRQNDLSQTQHLLEQLPPHVNLQLVGFSFFTPLLFAAYLGHAKIVSYLLGVLSRTHIEAVDNYGRNALMNAVCSGSVETVRRLAVVLDPHSRDRDGNTCLHLATRSAVAVVLVEDFRLNPDAINLHNASPMHCAAILDTDEVVRVLVRAGGDVSKRDAAMWTPLHHAAYLGCRDTVQFLLDSGADPGAKNSEGCSPIDLAKDEELRELLLREKAPIGSPVLSSSMPEVSVELSPLQKSQRQVLEVDSIGATVSPEPFAPASYTSISGLVKKNKSMLSIDLDSLTKYGVEVVSYSELKLKNELGRGGYGRVYSGNFRNNHVAIKVVNDRGLSEKLVRDFLKEIECLVKIRHHRFLLLQGICLEGPLCIVTELARGGNLSDAIDKGWLETSDKLLISKQIAEGMAFIHSKTPPIIHRDLKPQNILLDSFKQVKIGDLGLSRTAGSNAANSMRLEATELFAGTIRYMAPEHFDDNPVITRGTDVWAFGCILFQLFTGKAPWSGLELPAVQRRLLLKTELPLDSELNPEIKALISACCNLQAALRPKFGEIVQRLEEVQASLGIPSSQPS